LRILYLLLSLFYKIWALLVFSICVILFFPFSIIPFLISQRAGWFTYKVFFLWAWIFSVLTFIQFDIKGKEKIDRGRSYIFIVNHTSFLDAIGIALAIPVQFRTLAKKELLKIPLLGLILKKASIIVDRSSHQSRKVSIDQMKGMLGRGISILIFPEGTQNRTSNPLSNFHTGAFRIAKDTETSIIPVVIKGAGKLMPPSTFSIRPGKVKMMISDEITVDSFDLESIEELTGRVRDIMLKMMIDVQKERVVN